MGPGETSPVLLRSTSAEKQALTSTWLLQNIVLELNYAKHSPLVYIILESLTSFKIRQTVRQANWLPVCTDLNTPCPLQTIYGELISLESNDDTLGLAMFILQRLLWNPDIAAEFRHAKVPHLYKDGRQKVKYLKTMCVEILLARNKFLNRFPLNLTMVVSKASGFTYIKCFLESLL